MTLMAIFPIYSQSSISTEHTTLALTILVS